jgi:LytS/YehU family sensor histidine kinase
MNDSVMLTLGSIFDKICILVTAAFALALVPNRRRPERSLLSIRDRGTALLVFLVLGLVEEAAVRRTGWFNHRIVAVCTAGLLAGPSVGVVIGAVVTWAAVAYDGRPLVVVGVLMLGGGVIGGWLHRWQPQVAQRPLTGFCVTFGVSLLRDGLTFLYAPNAQGTLKIFGVIGIGPVLQGLGTALILAIVVQVRERDEQARAAASAEVLALRHA